MLLPFTFIRFMRVRVGGFGIGFLEQFLLIYWNSCLFSGIVVFDYCSSFFWITGNVCFVIIETAFFILTKNQKKPLAVFIIFTLVFIKSFIISYLSWNFDPTSRGKITFRSYLSWKFLESLCFHKTKISSENSEMTARLQMQYH